VNIPKLLASMATEVHALETPEEVVDRVGHFGRIAIDADDSGILLLRRGRSENAGHTSERVAKAHAIQVELNEGPCIDVLFAGPTTYICHDTLTDARWQNWGPRAAELGYRSTLSVQLRADGKRFGSLNIYSSEPNTFTASDAETVEFLAAHASVAIAAAQSSQTMKAALDSRTSISQAQGMLMLAMDIDAEAAFNYLRRLSQSQNRKLAVIAEQVIDNRQQLNPR
jgi:GAF domain-containing protein